MLFIASAFCPAIWIKAKINLLPLPKGSTKGNCGPKLLKHGAQTPVFSRYNQGSSDGLHPNSDGLQPRSDGLQPRSDGVRISMNDPSRHRCCSFSHFQYAPRYKAASNEALWFAVPKANVIYFSIETLRLLYFGSFLRGRVCST